jgi:hypothetical protein
MSYGTQTPTRYEPFPGTTSYWQPLNMLIVIILAELLCAIRWRRAAAAAGALLCLMAIGVLGMSGPWGQNVELSRALMAYAKQRPARRFVTDDRTLTQMYVLNGFEPVSNVYAYPQSRGNRFFRATTMPAEPPAGMLVLVNPLNDMEKNPSFRWLEARCGREVDVGVPRYRMLTYLLPGSYRRAHAWTVRRPAPRVCEFRESRQRGAGGYFRRTMTLCSSLRRQLMACRSRPRKTLPAERSISPVARMARGKCSTVR